MAESKVYSNQVLFSICSQSAVRLCTTLLGFCHQSVSITCQQQVCHISDSNLLTISNNTNSVHNLLPFCNQKLLADSAQNLSPQALLSGIIIKKFRLWILKLGIQKFLEPVISNPKSKFINFQNTRWRTENYKNH